MIHGAKFYNSEKAYLKQNDNSSETLIGKLLKKLVKYPLETCGPTAACICLAALGYPIFGTATRGGYKPQPEDLLNDWLNSPAEKKKREAARAGVDYIPGGRIPQYFPAAAACTFGEDIKSKFSWSGRSWKYITSRLKKGDTVQAWLKHPRHSIALLAFDEENETIIFNDPNIKRRGLKNKGFNEKMSKKEFIRNMQSYCVVYFTI